MAARWKESFPVIAAGLVLVALFMAVMYFTLINPLPQTEQHLGCTTDSPRFTLIAPATIFSDAYDWSTLVGPSRVQGTLSAGDQVCLTAHDDWNPQYALVVYPDPEGNGDAAKYLRGWVELETLPLEARHVQISIVDPWESSTYP